MLDKKTNNEPEQPEYRIFTSSNGSQPVVWQAFGDTAMEEFVRRIRQLYPNDTIFVREVFQHVKLVIYPDGTRKELN